MIESIIYSRLKSTSPVTDLVGSGDNTRIYPIRLPQDTEYPALTFTLISTVRTSSMDGFSNLVTARFQIDIYSETFDQVKSLGLAVRDALEDYKAEVNNIQVWNIEYESVQNLWLDDVDLYREIQDLIIYHQET